MVSELNSSDSTAISIVQPGVPTLLATGSSGTRKLDSRQSHLRIIVSCSPFLKDTVTLQRSKGALLEKFERLVKHWHVQRGVSSSVTQGALCPAYQSIIGMGSPAVPLLLRRLKSERDDPDQWFWALNAITGCQPVPEEDLGNFVKMACHWLNWGRQNGYDL